jgi:hypothetical protein
VSTASSYIQALTTRLLMMSSSGGQLFDDIPLGSPPT